MTVQIGGLVISWYGLLLVVGILAGASAGYVLTCICQLEYDKFIQLSCFTGLGAMIGAKILYVIVSWEKIDFSMITNPQYFNELMSGGFVFYGGLAGGLVGLYFCWKLLHISVMEYAQATIPVIPLTHAFGRIGCALAGCCYGVPYDGPGAVIYTESIGAPLYVPLFPVQAVEAAGNFLIVVILCLYLRMCRIKGEKPKGIQVYLALYAVMRFALEFVRNDDNERGILFGMSTSQWISIVIFAGVIIVENCLQNRTNKEEKMEIKE